MAVGCLGEGEYDVRFVSRRTTLSGPLSLGEAKLLGGSWERKLSETSTASASFPTGDGSSACVDLLARLRPWRDEAEFYRDGELCWAGPVTNIAADPGSETATVSAVDLSGWWEKRALLVDLISRGVDLAAIFELYLTTAFAVDDPGLVIVTTPTGIIGDRTVAASDAKLLSAELDELSRTGVDWTVAGRTFWIGGQEITAGGRLPGRLVDEHFRTPPQTRRSGDGMVNDAIVRADTITGRVGGPDPIDGVLLQGVSDESSIEDQGSADAAAQTWWDLAHEALVFLEGDNALDPSAPIELAELIPGVVIGVDLGGGGVVPLLTDLRLQSVSVDVDADGEEITIGMQPVGTTIGDGI